MERFYQYSVEHNFTSASETKSKTINIDKDYNFVVLKMVATCSASFTVSLKSGGKLFTNKQINNANIFGTAQLPNILLTPLILLRGTDFTVDMVNGSTASNSVEIVFEGYLTDKMIPIQKQWKQYGFEQLSFTSTSQSLSTTINIDDTYDFVIQKIVGTDDASGDYQVFITANMNMFSNDLINAKNIIGTAQYPNILSKPFLLTKRSSIILQVLNGATASNNVNIVLEGYEIYK